MDVNVSLFGSVINNGNLGCLALSYSLIDLLDKIAVNNELKFIYHIFEFAPDSSVKLRVSDSLNIENNRIVCHKIENYNGILRRVKHIQSYSDLLRTVKKSKFAIDLTEGDSFSDIYGQDQFDNSTTIKEIIEGLHTPLILGSQTYGPYQAQSNFRRAIDVINKSYCVIARDEISKEYLSQSTYKNILTTSDIAFRLPYHNEKAVDNIKPINIGINISGLLVEKKTENTVTNFVLKSHYGTLLENIISRCLKNGMSVHLISHVEEDFAASKAFKTAFPEAVLVDPFMNPIDAKSYISNMDLFIGSRMHATIAAMTSGVPCIPLAYSRKFKGVFDSVDYPYVVDLQELGTEQAFETVKKYIESYLDLVEAEKKSKILADKAVEDTYKLYEKVIMSCINRKR